MDKQEPKQSAEAQPLKLHRMHMTLAYPQHSIDPEDLLDFIELRQFTKRWEKLGLNDENDLAALQLFIMAKPRGAPIISGTHGLRKLRFSPGDWSTGKSGALRILYVYFEQHGIVLLCLVYAHNEISNISDAVKSQLNKIIKEAEREIHIRGSF